MQNHRVIHREAKVHLRQILWPGQEVVVKQGTILPDSQQVQTLDEMKTEEEGKAYKTIFQETQLMIEGPAQEDHSVEWEEIVEIQE